MWTGYPIDPISLLSGIDPIVLQAAYAGSVDRDGIPFGAAYTQSMIAGMDESQRKSFESAAKAVDEWARELMWQKDAPHADLAKLAISKGQAIHFGTSREPYEVVYNLMAALANYSRRLAAAGGEMLKAIEASADISVPTDKDRATVLGNLSKEFKGLLCMSPADPFTQSAAGCPLGPAQLLGLSPYSAYDMNATAYANAKFLRSTQSEVMAKISEVARKNPFLFSALKGDLGKYAQSIPDVLQAFLTAWAYEPGFPMQLKASAQELLNGVASFYAMAFPALPTRHMFAINAHQYPQTDGNTKWEKVTGGDSATRVTKGALVAGPNEQLAPLLFLYTDVLKDLLGDARKRTPPQMGLI